jgi:hypothetical protein
VRDRRVADGDEIVADVEREPPRHLAVGLVDTREDPARVDRLRLRGDVGVAVDDRANDAEAPVVARAFRALERDVGDRGGVLERERPAALRERSVEADQLIGVVDTQRHRRGADRGRFRDGEADAVEPDLGGVLGEVAGDLDRGREAVLVEGEVRAVAGRLEGVREPERRRRGRGGAGDGGDHRERG